METIIERPLALSLFAFQLLASYLLRGPLPRYEADPDKVFEAFAFQMR